MQNCREGKKTKDENDGFDSRKFKFLIIDESRRKYLYSKNTCCIKNQAAYYKSTADHLV